IEGYRSFERLSAMVQTLQHAPNLWSLLAHYLLIESTLVLDKLDQSGQPINSQSRAILADYEKLLQLARHYDRQQEQALNRMQSMQLLSDSPELESAPVLPPMEAVDEEPTVLERTRGFLEYLCLLVLLRQDGGSRQNAQDDEEGSANIIRVMTVHASK